MLECHEAVAKAGELRGGGAVRTPLRWTIGGWVRGNPQSSGGVQDAGRLPIVALLLWALLAFVVPSFVQALNLIDVLAFPLGYYLAAQGVLLAFVAIGVVSARWQDRRAVRAARKP
ncbi:MAG: DUF4212 domain-containing protein [Hyphomicrobium sp.]|nr:DUF4212 domain-containing protein [Hyphomicrobium sp.]